MTAMIKLTGIDKIYRSIEPPMIHVPYAFSTVVRWNEKKARKHLSKNQKQLTY